MKKIVHIAFMASVIVINGMFFSSCRKNEGAVTAKTEKVNISIPTEGILEGEGDYCSSIYINWSLFYYDFVISYLDDSGTIRFYFVPPQTELGQKLSDLFLQKVLTFRGTAEAYCEWSKARMKEGLIVVGHKDRETGEYIGAAYTLQEWRDKGLPL